MSAGPSTATAWLRRPIAIDPHPETAPRSRMSRSTTPKTAARPSTLGELRASGYQSRTVKEELRTNLLSRLAAGEDFLPGVVGYNETVVPAVENAILAGQDLVFLGERGQAKTRIARLLAGLLDEVIPVVAGG